MSTVKDIEDEWRTFIVNGKYSSGSHYKSFGRTDIHSNVPQHVIDFSEQVAAIYSPAKVFVVDVCSHNGELKIVELNGFNSSGFYEANIKKIFSDILTMENL